LTKRSLLPLSLLAFTLCASAPLTHAEDSLLNPAQARPLTTPERSLFGPRAAKLHYDPRMIQAAEIARQRAEPRMTWHCWHYVKDALLAAGVVDSLPTSSWAKNAGTELCEKYGFIKLKIRDPRKAPIGAVVVYGGADAGHVELRTPKGFVSDFISRTPYPRPLVGIYVKPA
jgi:hypothetical protein